MISDGFAVRIVCVLVQACAYKHKYLHGGINPSLCNLLWCKDFDIDLVGNGEREGKIKLGVGVVAEHYDFYHDSFRVSPP